MTTAVEKDKPRNRTGKWFHLNHLLLVEDAADRYCQFHSVSFCIREVRCHTWGGFGSLSGWLYLKIPFALFLLGTSG